MEHGTITGYRYHGCRCAKCRRAHSESNTEYQRTPAGKRYRQEMQERGAPPPGRPHGYSAYVNYGCRCSVCHTAKAEYAAARRASGLDR